MQQTPTAALSELLTYIEQNQVKDCGEFRSEEFAGYLERARQALSAVPRQASPFARYRDKIMGHYGTAHWLQELVMHLWNSRDYSLALNRIGGFDSRHRQIALELIEHYAKHGENDREFMSLAADVRTRLEAEATAADA